MAQFKISFLVDEKDLGPVARQLIQSGHQVTWDLVEEVQTYAKNQKRPKDPVPLTGTLGLEILGVLHARLPAPVPVRDIKRELVPRGYKKNSISPRLSQMCVNDLVAHVGEAWTLTQKGEESFQAARYVEARKAKGYD